MSGRFLWTILGILALLSGCKSLPSRPVERIMRDTVYVYNQRLDSVYIYQDRLTDRSHDTVRVQETRMEYRYRFLRDTIHRIERDSIPYEVVVYRERPSAWPRSGWMLTSLCFILLLFLYKFIK